MFDSISTFRWSASKSKKVESDPAKRFSSAYPTVSSCSTNQHSYKSNTLTTSLRATATGDVNSKGSSILIEPHFRGNRQFLGNHINNKENIGLVSSRVETFFWSWSASIGKVTEVSGNNPPRVKFHDQGDDVEKLYY
jgi:hypothetical protein